MIQYIIVFAIVAIAGIYVVRRLISQARGRGGCSGDCHCALKDQHKKAKSLTGATGHE